MRAPKFDPHWKGKALPSHKGYLGSRWAGLRRAWLRQHPLCEKCGVVGEEVHHPLPRSTHPEMRFAWSNLMTLCRRCHDEVHRNSPK